MALKLKNLETTPPQIPGLLKLALEEARKIDEELKNKDQTLGYEQFPEDELHEVLDQR